MRSFGKYEIHDKIGVGGFGEVFKGYDPFIKRYVAIKTCTSQDDTIRRRFALEAEISGNLQHRNIVTVFDFGIEGGVPYLVQEFLLGRDLDQLIERGEEIEYSKRLLYLLQVARGLEYAHRKGIAHRDVKPANVRVLPDDTAKLMDFGVAKLIHEESFLTKTGMTLGTASYVSPEQIRGETVDHRTDIFSFGILAHELLTFELPFPGRSFSEVLQKIITGAPQPIRELRPDYPPRLQELVLRCLAKDPDDRYADCGELVPELRALRLEASSTSAR